MNGKLYLVAGEASGDVLGREVVDAIRDKASETDIRATGGAELCAVVPCSDVDVSGLAVLGFWEGIQAYSTVKRLVRATVADILSYGPSVVVLIDSWGFTLRIAQALRRAAPQIRLIKLIGPQVWATRSGRAATLAACVDHLLCIHDFERPYYEPYGLRTTTIGHPALGRVSKGAPDRFRHKYNVSDEARLLAVFPGSRPSEVARMGQDLVEAAARVQQALPNTHIIFAPAGPVIHAFRALPYMDELHLCLEPEDRYDLMAAADLALACSGTVTTEIAMQGTAVITGYRTGTLTWFLARNFLMKADYITLLNMAADKMIVPEFLQGDFTGAQLSQAGLELLQNDDKRHQQIAAQNDALQVMGQGRPAAAMLAAEAILTDLCAVSG